MVVCTLFAYLYFEFPIERVKFLEYKSLANICISESLIYYYWCVVALNMNQSRCITLNKQQLKEGH